jgi:membrane associated rhomboid family serine protease
MLLPYRVKNRPERFPIATLVIIVVNVIVYAATTDGLTIRESVVKSFAFGLGRTPLWNCLTSMFLHADPFHIAGNMFFLWIFGPSVEGRLRIPRYLAVYFAAGLCGNLLQGLLMGSGLTIGASGCIMGVLGSFWYLFAWSPVCIFYWFYIFWRGTFEVAALWVIAAYVVMDMGEGFLLGSIGMKGGVANFAHVGGAFAGALLCLSFRAKRDSIEMSEAKAVHADMKDISILPLSALQTMIEEDPGNPELIRAAIKPAISFGQESIIHEAMAKAGTSMLDKDPGLVAYYLLTFHGDPRLYQAVHLLRGAGVMERNGDLRQAMSLYYYVIRNYPPSPDIEMAFYRMAQCYWKGFGDGHNAGACLAEMQKRYPTGALRPYAQGLSREIGSVE